MHRCLCCFLCLDCSSGLGVWVSAMARDRVMSQSDVKFFLQHCCAVGKAMSQYRFGGSFGWFRVRRLLTTREALHLYNIYMVITFKRLSTEMLLEIGIVSSQLFKSDFFFFTEVVKFIYKMSAVFLISHIAHKWHFISALVFKACMLLL